MRWHTLCLSVAFLLSFLCTAPASGRRLSREHLSKSAKSPDSSPESPDSSPGSPDSSPGSGEGARSFGELDTSSISGTYAMVLETGADRKSVV